MSVVSETETNVSGVEKKCPGAKSIVSANLSSISARILRASLKVGRSPAEVLLVAISKAHTVERIREALNAGHRVFGENRIQEALQKWPALKADYPDAQLHLVGPIQTNKVRDAVALFDVIETVDRPRLAAKLAEEMSRQSRHLPCFIQVNTGEEPQKVGISPKDADLFIQACRVEYGLNIHGLMCIPPRNEESAVHFAFLREIARRNDVVSLSMGMSADFETAIELGATHVRLGTAIFGERPIKP